ncbi:hypothetical protein [Neorhizobium sp. DT-125]|uniref:hypothetical protein n=1 Tax=Neorhizobium sp. DT-125 TaxID=3396163 RepID=UPI003F1979BE
MSSSQPNDRYDLRNGGSDTDEIFGTETGRTVSVGGKARAKLKFDEADVLAGMLNSRNQEPDEETLH